MKKQSLIPLSAAALLLVLGSTAALAGDYGACKRRPGVIGCVKPAAKSEGGPEALKEEPPAAAAAPIAVALPVDLAAVAAANAQPKAIQNCSVHCTAGAAAIGCPTGSVPFCQCVAEPFAACRVEAPEAGRRP